MIKVIAFDYGGVIEISDYDVLNDIINILGVEKEEWRKVYFTHNHLSNVDNLKWEDLIIFISKELGATDDQLGKIQMLLQKKEDSKKINTELIEMIQKFKQKYKIVLLSNYSKELRDRLKKQEILKLFDEVIISSEVGFQKPNLQIFSILCEKLHIDISELAFVDDTPKSLEGAAELGYTPILYKNNNELLEEFDRLNI